jgi:hypothetical protein
MIERYWVEKRAEKRGSSSVGIDPKSENLLLSQVLANMAIHTIW